LHLILTIYKKILNQVPVSAYTLPDNISHKTRENGHEKDEEF